MDRSELGNDGEDVVDHVREAGDARLSNDVIQLRAGPRIDEGLESRRCLSIEPMFDVCPDMYGAEAVIEFR